MSVSISTINPSPPEAVGRPLTLVASDALIRILDGAHKIARRRRSYDRHQSVLEPAHQQALLQLKRKAFHLLPLADWPKRYRKAKLFWISPLPAGNPRAAKPPNCSSCWTSTAPRLCAARFAKRWNAIPHAPLRWPFCSASVSRLHPPRDLWQSILANIPRSKAIEVQPHNLETYDDLARHDDDSDDPDE